MREERFDFSEFPSRWAPAILSLLTAVVVMRVGHAAVVTHEPLVPMMIAIGVFAAVGLFARYLTRRGVLEFPLSRRSSVNLVATPTVHEPALWLVAHLDSKSQTIPMLVRIAAVTVFAVAALVVMAAATVVTMAGHGSPELLHRAVAVAHHSSLMVTISSLPLVLCFIGNRSRGALDDATGVATVLLAAQMLEGRNIGVLLTSGEELGLAGARAFARTHAGRSIAINCDTVDDAGTFLFMRSRRPSPVLERAVKNASGKGTRAMLPGVMADNIALSDAGWDSFTISRGNLGTLARVHTSRDRADNIDGTGIAQASLLIAAIVEELT